MRKETLNRFKKMFVGERRKLLFTDRVVREDFSVNTDDRFDEVDQATTDVEQSMRMRLCNRETLYLKKVEEALRRIDEGTFGLCEACEEEIGLKRLEARPTATLCVSCKEEQERKEVHTAAGLAHKSLGESFSKRFA
jgi:DnaK suppressor protein